jgi:protein O-GlcNAc transferase
VIIGDERRDLYLSCRAWEILLSTADVAIQTLCEQALDAHRAGRLAEAEAGYTEILRRDPKHADALHLLGVIALSANRLDSAAELARAAIACGSPSADMHNTLGIALRSSGSFDEALSHFATATVLRPSLAIAWLNRGATLLDLGRPEPAARCFERCLALAPDRADAKLGLDLARQQAPPAHAGSRATAPEPVQPCPGLDLLASGQPSAARLFFAFFAEALEGDPGNLQSQIQLGRACLAAPPRSLERKDFEFVLSLTEEWAVARPDCAELHDNRGALLKHLGRFEEAELALHRALEIDFDLVEARFNLAVLLLNRDEPTAALEQLDALALAKDEDSLPPRERMNVLITRSAALSALGRNEAALAALRAAVALDTGDPLPYLNLSAMLGKRGEGRESRDAIRQAMALSAAPAEAHSNLIFQLELEGHEDERSEQAERRRWHECYGRTLSESVAPHLNRRDPDRRLRIGYVSGNFYRHAVARVIAPVLLNHDPDRFEIVCYANCTHVDEITENFRQAASMWRPIFDLRDEQVAKLIRDDEIDILVDLSGHTAENRLLVFARKPAPVQVTAWGLPRGTGIDSIDYIFSDPVLIPPEQAGALAETVLYLPCWMPYSPLDDDVPVAPPPRAGSGPITFGSFNRLAKASDACLAAWGRILRLVPDSRMLVIDGFSPNPSFEQRAARSDLPLERLEFRPPCERRRYLESYGEIDLMLDTFPQGGGVTSFDSLWMGVPPLTLLGRSSSGRGSAAILNVLDLNRFVAESVEDYIELAVALAADRSSLVALRSELRDRLMRSPIGDGPTYTKAVETAYREAWRRWCASSLRS